MRCIPPILGLAILAGLGSCRPAPLAQPIPDNADTRAVMGFLEAYGRHDLDGMMRHLDEDAVFRGSGGTLPKPKIRDFFQATFRKHPNLKVEVGALRVVQGAVHAAVKVHADVTWSDTWIFELRNHRILAYGLASGLKAPR